MAIAYSIIFGLIMFYSYAIFGMAIISWFPSLSEKPIGVFLRKITEPYVAPFRMIIPQLGPVDLSLLAAYICLQLASAGLYDIFILLGMK